MAAGMVSTAHLTIRIIRRLLTAMFADRDRRIRTVGLALVTCILPATAIISVPTVASAQTTSTTPTVKIVSPLAGSCATGSTRNLQASFTGTGTVSYMSYFLNGAWEKQVNGALSPWNYTGNYANGTYTLVAKATLTTGTVITSPAVTWSRLTTCPTTTTTVAPATTTTAATTTTTIAPVTTTTTTPPSGTTTTTIATSGIPALRAIKITSPINGSCYETSLWNLEAQVTGDLTATEVHYYLDNAWHAYSTTAPWTHTENYAYGTYNLTAKATLSNGTIITSPQTTWTRGPTCPYEPPPTTTTTTTTTIAPPNYTAPTIQTPANGSCTTNQNITFTATAPSNPATYVASITYNFIGNGMGQIVTANGPAPFSTTKTLANGTYTLNATANWAYNIYPAATTPNPTTFTIASECAPPPTTTTTLPPTTTTTTTTTLPPANASISLNVPTNVVPGEVVTGTITNVLPTDTVTIRIARNKIQTLVASPTISFRAPTAGLYDVAIERNNVLMASAPFLVTTPPTVALTGSFKEGFPLDVNLTGTLDPTDRVRIDTLGQADLCAACTDPGINKPAAPNVTFDNTPTAGTYQVRILRRDQTIALKTFTTEPLPKANLQLWRLDRQGYPPNPDDPTSLPITPGCQRIWNRIDGSEFSYTYTKAIYIWTGGPGIVSYNRLDNGGLEHSDGWQWCPTNPTDLTLDGNTPYAQYMRYTLTGHNPQTGDYLQVSPTKQIQPGDWFRLGDIANTLRDGETFITGAYHTTIAGRDTEIGYTALRAFKQPIYIPIVCVLSPDQFNTYVGNNAYYATTTQPPSGNCTDLNYQNILWLDANGNEIPGQRFPDGTLKPIAQRGTTDPQAPPKLTISQPPPAGAHPFIDGVPTDLKVSTDLSCVTADAGVVLQVSPLGADCLVILPVAMPGGGWKLLSASDPGDCLVSTNGTLQLAQPCVGASYFNDRGAIGLAFPLHPESALTKCLEVSSTSQPVFSDCRFDNAGNAEPSQLWYDQTTGVTTKDPDRWLGKTLSIYGDDGTYGPPVPVQLGQPGNKDQRLVSEIRVAGICVSGAGGNTACQDPIDATVMRNGFERLIGAFTPVDEDIEDTEYVDVTKTVFNRIATKEDKYIRKNVSFGSMSNPLRHARAQFVLEGGSIQAAERLYFYPGRSDLREGISEDPWGQAVIDTFLSLGVEAVATRAAPIIWAAASSHVATESGHFTPELIFKLVSPTARAEATAAARGTTTAVRRSLGAEWEIFGTGVMRGEVPTFVDKAPVKIFLKNQVRGRNNILTDELSMVLDGLHSTGAQTIVEGGVTKSVRAFRYTEFKLSKFSSFTRNQRYFARMFKDSLATSGGPTPYVKVVVQKDILGLGLVKDQEIFITSVETFIKNGSMTVRSGTIDSFSISTETKLLPR
jgi:hypothetical protein